MALIPPFFIDCVVAIGTDKKDTKGNVYKHWIATGFLYGYYLEDIDKYKVFLVTNRHVFKNLSMIYLRFNPQADEAAWDYRIDLLDENKVPVWFTHPRTEIDIAILAINFNILKDHNIQASFFPNNKNAADIDKMNELEITEGDLGYVLGFPMGLVGDHRNTVIVRNASIARIRDALSKNNIEFLVDAFVFPGNSGGPVVLKPEGMAISGTSALGAAWLIGIVRSYVPYQDVAYSRQTERPRVIFEENTGLASVHPVDFIEEVIHVYLKSIE